MDNMSNEITADFIIDVSVCADIIKSKRREITDWMEKTEKDLRLLVHNEVPKLDSIRLYWRVKETISWNDGDEGKKFISMYVADVGHIKCYFDIIEINNIPVLAQKIIKAINNHKERYDIRAVG